MQYSLQFFVLVMLLEKAQLDWVEIIQKPKMTPASVNKETLIVTGSKGSLASDFTTPSKEWLEYQQERFSPSNSNKLIVSATGNLKHSSHVIVPANVQIIQTKTKLEVKNNQPPEADVNVAVTSNVETTSRRDMTHINEAEMESEEGDGAEEATADINDNEDEHDLQLPSMQGFLKFLKSMQVSWLKKSAYSIEKKIEMLKQLKDNLMKVIVKQFTSLWQPTERKRLKRGLLDESNLNFPPEAAIMSINFLTFAVFLIKLVLQVVHIVKSKHYNFAGFNINTDVVRKTTNT